MNDNTHLATIDCGERQFTLGYAGGGWVVWQFNKTTRMENLHRFDDVEAAKQFIHNNVEGALSDSVWRAERKAAGR